LRPVKIKKGSNSGSGDHVAVLILSGLADFPTDRVCHHLASRRVPFLRINRDQLPKIALTINPPAGTMICKHEGRIWQVSSELRSVWWRQPTFLRNTPNRGLTAAEQLERSQWAAAMRGMMLFNDAKWVNHPAATYQAESKPYQLRRAAKFGFDVPPTLVTNDPSADVPRVIGKRIALKSVDTVLLQDERHQHFGYTSLIAWAECVDEHFHQVPVVCQSMIDPKIDLRVTVIGDRIWCDAITDTHGAIQGDWRLRQKSDLLYKDYDLPADVAERCALFVRDLGLRYGAIDLALSGSLVWFLEINPTGEWGWLDRRGRGISEAIAEELARP
jgi:glutathione synthase/RimK-type ligase-like ATP-grasp enzyme